MSDPDDEREFQRGVFISPAPKLHLPPLDRTNPGYVGYRRAMRLQREEDLAIAVGVIVGLVLVGFSVLLWWML